MTGILGVVAVVGVPVDGVPTMLLKGSKLVGKGAEMGAGAVDGIGGGARAGTG